MSSILVTGGAGFLGSHLCDRLIERGDDVICVDNFFTGSKENVRHLLGHPRFELIRHDIVHPLYVEAERIFNLACPASPEAYQFNPIKTIKTSTVGMVNMMGLAKRCGRCFNWPCAGWPTTPRATRRRCQSAIEAVLECLYKRQINSVIIEGGSKTLQHFIDGSMWDEARIITNTVLFLDKGVKAPVLHERKLMTSFDILSDRIEYFQNIYNDSL